MPRDEWGNIISEAEYDHFYRPDSITYTIRDELGNIIERGRQPEEL